MRVAVLGCVHVFAPFVREGRASLLESCTRPGRGIPRDSGFRGNLYKEHSGRVCTRYLQGTRAHALKLKNTIFAGLLERILDIPDRYKTRPEQRGPRRNPWHGVRVLWLAGRRTREWWKRCAGSGSVTGVTQTYIRRRASHRTLAVWGDDLSCKERGGMCCGEYCGI